MTTYATLGAACLRCNSVAGTEIRELIKRGVLFVPGRQAAAA
jgi:hypothetical protein